MTARSSAPSATNSSRGGLLFGCILLMLGSLWCGAQGSAVPAIGGALLGALALRGFAFALTEEAGRPDGFVVDGLVLAALGLAVEPGAALWGAPQTVSDLARLTPVGAAAAISL